MKRESLAALALLAGASVVACGSSDSSPPSSTDRGVDSGGAGSPSNGGSDAASPYETGAPPSDASDGDGTAGAGSDGSVPTGAPHGDAGAGLADSGASACPSGSATGSAHAVKYVFVVAMENHDSGEIIGNTKDAPYINQTLIPCYASASNFNDPLALAIPSEPHYVWMEGGTNAFSDTTFTSDNDPSSSNSTSSKSHLTDQLKAASVTWLTYQEGLDPATTGACPISTAGYYAAKHDPFVFFQDVSGSPPAMGNAYCSQHHKPLTALAGDLTGSSVAQYNFITPNLCNDMHGASGCPNSNTVQAGDLWLAANVPAILTFANAHDGAVFIVWDEGDHAALIPFLALGPGVKRNYIGAVSYTHSSLVATAERIFGVSRLSTVAAAADFADLFQAGALP